MNNIDRAITYIKNVINFEMESLSYPSVRSLSDAIKIMESVKDKCKYSEILQEEHNKLLIKLRALEKRVQDMDRIKNAMTVIKSKLHQKDLPPEYADIINEIFGI